MPQPQTNGQEIRGWKEIAAHLGVSVRTAQTFEKEQGLPVRRGTGVKAPVYAVRAEIQAWTPRPSDVPLQELTAMPTESAVGRRQWLGRALGTAGMVIGGLGLWAGARKWSIRPRPSAYRVDGAILSVMTEDGSVLWRHRFPFPLMTEYYQLGARRCLFVDVDGDGQSETLFTYCPFDRPNERSLVCFDVQGGRRWEFLAGKAVEDNLGRRFNPPFWPNFFEVVNPQHSRASQIVVSSNHHYSFANQVAVVDGKSGRLLSEYWHRGHLYHISVADLNGAPSVLLSGVNDAPDYKKATVVAFDQRHISGATRNPRGGVYFQGMQPGTETVVVFFPRTPISRDEEFNLVIDVRVTRDNITAIVVEGTAITAPSLAYEVDHFLKVINVMLSGPLQERYLTLQEAGVLPRESFEAISDRLKRQVHVIRY